MVFHWSHLAEISKPICYFVKRSHGEPSWTIIRRKDNRTNSCPWHGQRKNRRDTNWVPKVHIMYPAQTTHHVSNMCVSKNSYLSDIVDPFVPRGNNDCHKSTNVMQTRKTHCPCLSKFVLKCEDIADCLFPFLRQINTITRRRLNGGERDGVN